MHVEQLERDLTDAKHEIDACKNENTHNCETFARDQAKFSECDRAYKNQIQALMNKDGDSEKEFNNMKYTYDSCKQELTFKIDEVMKLKGMYEE